MAGVLRALALEVPARWGAPDETLAWVRARLVGRDDVDLVVLPEACLTGYVSPRGSFDPTALAEPWGGPISRGLASLARERRVHVAGPLIERDGDCVYNACIVVDPRGELVARHRKRHPWYPEAWATPGNAPHPLFEIAGVRLTIAICFDVHFLATEADDVLERADALLFPSAWVEDDPAGDARAPIFEDLARRFDVAIVNANWGPGDVRLVGQGGSRVVDRHGRRHAEDGVVTLSPKR